MRGIIIICPIVKPFVYGLDEDDDIAVAVALDGHTFVVFGTPAVHGSEGPVQVTLANHDEVSHDSDASLPLVWLVTSEGHDQLTEHVQARLLAIEEEMRVKYLTLDLDKDLVALNQGHYNTEGFHA